MRKICLIIATLLVTTTSISYGEDSRGGAWLGTFTKKKMTNVYSIWAETQARYDLSQGGMSQILYRAGLLQGTGMGELGYLYGYIQSPSLKEHRLTLQHAGSLGSSGNWAFSQRTRLEGRFLEDSADDSGRLRFLLRAEQNYDNEFNFVTWNEFFFNLTQDDWTGDREYERNRFFFGVKSVFFDSRLEAGYLNQYVPRESGDISEHILTVYFFI